MEKGSPPDRIRLRRDLRMHEFAVVDGRRRRLVADWIARGRGHAGYAFGEDAGDLLELLDGRTKGEVVAAARQRLGSRFGGDHLARLAHSLDAKRLLDTPRSRRWLRSIHREAVALGRRPPAAPDDSWYPRDPTLLRPLVEGLIEEGDDAVKDGDPKTRAVISPHAGLDACGSCAGRAHAARSRVAPPKTIVLLGPNHCYRRDEIDVGSLPFDGPLGCFEADERLAARLRASLGGCASDGLAQFRDHSLEMQLPFLAHLTTVWRRKPRIVPILICRSMPDGFFRPAESQLRDLDRLATALASALRDPHTVLVASGDLTHYGLAFDFVPFTDDVNARIRAFDRPALEALQSLDVPRFLECMATRNWCGGPSFYVLMRIALLLGWAPRLSDYLVPAEEDWRPHGRTASFAAVTFLES